MLSKKIVLVIFVNEVDDDFDHCVLFFGAAFGYHEGEGERVLSAIRLVPSSL